MWFVYFIGGLFFVLGLCLLAAIPMVHRHLQKITSSPAELRLSFEDISLVTPDQIKLYGWWIPANDSEQTIIMLHGHAGSMDPDLKYVPALHAAGFNTLMFDFRAHGRSSGRLGTIGALEINDVKTAADYAIARGSKRIGLLGFSMGGRAAILAAPTFPGVNSIISDGGPARLTTAITQELIQRKVPPPIAFLLSRMMLIGGTVLSGINLFGTEPFHKAKFLCSTPALFIHGEKDPFTTTNEFYSMVKDAGKFAEFWVVPEAGHRDIDQYQPVEYMHKVISFFQKTL